MGAAKSCIGPTSYSSLDLLRNGSRPERRRTGMSDTEMSTKPFMSDDEDLDSELYPCLKTMSAAFFYKAVVVPRKEPPPPQFVFVPHSPDAALGEEPAIGYWNLAWEWGPNRSLNLAARMPARLHWLSRRDDLN